MFIDVASQIVKTECQHIYYEGEQIMQEQQQANDGVEAAQRCFVVDGDWYSEEEAEGESDGESLILEMEYENEGESLNLDQELLDCELEDEVFYSGDGREDNPVVID